MSTAVAFELPTALEAHAPPAGGLRPAATRMLVATAADRLHHTTLADLPSVVEAGDLLVVNTSATLPASVPAADGLAVHFAGRLDEARALLELRAGDGAASAPTDAGMAGQRIALRGGGRVHLRSRWRAGRLWIADVALPGGLERYLARHGQPIRYGPQTPAWPLSAAQTIFAAHPGSAEAPSAALAFDDRLVTRLVIAGVGVTPVTLHAGVASLEDDEPPPPEWRRVPAVTALRVNAARAAGHRVIAVGTTVTRALESATAPDGSVQARSGWTALEISAEQGVSAVDGLLTGWHAPRASHLRLLEAVAGRDLVAASYQAALGAGYRWHTFGDLHLVLPESGAQGPEQAPVIRR